MSEREARLEAIVREFTALAVRFTMSGARMTCCWCHSSWRPNDEGEWHRPGCLTVRAAEALDA